MASDGLKTTIFALMFFIAFSTMITTFFIGMANNYGKDTSLVLGGTFNNTLFVTARENMTATTSSISERFDDSTQADEESDQDPTGLWNIFKSIGTIAVYPFLILTAIANNVLHIPSELLYTILAMISLTIIFGVWRLWKAGD